MNIEEKENIFVSTCLDCSSLMRSDGWSSVGAGRPSSYGCVPSCVESIRR